MKNLSVLLILGLAISQVYCGCAYTTGFGAFSGYCYNDCKDYATLSEAMAACDSSTSCGGVTFSQRQYGGGASTNAIGNGYGYQLRASYSGGPSTVRETTWFKSTCPDPHTPFEPCDYAQGQGVFLADCVQGCKDFSNLNDALNACRADPSCGGVTFSRKEIGGPAATNAFDGVWGFQLRAGSVFGVSQCGESSYVKQKCPVSQVQGTYCNYSKQSYQNFANLIQRDIQYTTEQSALTACDSTPDCTGVVLNQGSFYLATGTSSPSTTNSVAYTKGTCNVITYPILFSGCNFTGSQVNLTSDLAQIDLRQYKSLYIPAGKSVRFYTKSNFKGNNNVYTTSVYCQSQSFGSVFIQKAYSQDFSFETSIQVRDLKVNRKLKPNQN
ncbi:carboxy-terminal crystallin fold protein 9p (macronuclear) [Tetrahymena thermophila SB210]|uniref:Carboxy-terminal crystallin fold protein 9p n=2 Tax=Tetrahymena thermophila TaxID=5911 RepID=Q22M30_TETTS|nr:carboxy-terminal crystallin fold protein 9p [Tetrahymena thermophila SB210]ABC75096.1 C-terminal crystallin fold containing protein 10p [Tetrahymena thermophila]EAR86496.1 carboxy-terminal crystallin fold protein 9p [Tetrahymena thermophila SB210]|eukprot:XP_977190.1 carboxy-terminal crystallin fold protein 9p [Tetrahymena thermophila SB210]